MGVARLRCRAPAKINLGLKIVGRRADGLHELDSLFVPLDLADEIEIEIADAPDLRVVVQVGGRAEGVPQDATNLAARAATAFALAAGLRCEIRISCTKRIPTGAGLGGGSSDAGAVLRALSQRFPTSRASQRLAELALGLGADVPFFLAPRPARVRGIGERIDPVAGLPALWVLLANPGIPLSTAEVYRAFDTLVPALTPSSDDRTIPPLREVGSFREAAEAPVDNDLEAAAVRLCPPVGRLLAWLRAAGVPAGMSGSGSTVFGVFDSLAAAEQTMEKLAREPLGGEPPAWLQVAATIESR